MLRLLLSNRERRRAEIRATEEYSKALVCGLQMFRVLIGVEGESSLRDKPPCDFSAVYNSGTPILILGAFQVHSGLRVRLMGKLSSKSLRSGVQMAAFSLSSSGFIFPSLASVFWTTTKPCENSFLPRPQDFSKALYIFDIGQNDLTVGNMYLRLEIVWKNLCKKEAVSFWVHNTGPIGYLPAAVMKVTDPPPGFPDPHGCIKDQNDMAIEFNKQLKDAINKLRTRSIPGLLWVP
ncbi:hypothetical protein Ancab_002720 [Ancistrocladus abbreviatus]